MKDEQKEEIKQLIKEFVSTKSPGKSPVKSPARSKKAAVQSSVKVTGTTAASSSAGSVSIHKSSTVFLPEIVSCFTTGDVDAIRNTFFLCNYCSSVICCGRLSIYIYMYFLLSACTFC